ncbi:MAG: hypothetical protein LC685_04425 [Actinobacteria bacterium]|nr:hypothetical protein [Actinomycetota bacterium]
MRVRAVIRLRAGNSIREIREVLTILLDAVRRLREHDPNVELRIEHDDDQQPAAGGRQHWTTRPPD